MRWKALYILTPLLLIIGAGYFLGFDFILTKSIERSLEAVIGSKVEVDKLHFSIATPSLQIGRLQIANPRNTRRNLIETGDIQFKLAWAPLLSGKIVIEKIVLSEFMLNTPRKTDGKLRRPPLPGPLGKSQTKLNKAIAGIPLLNIESLQSEINQNKDKLLSNYQFQTEVDSEMIKTKLAESTQKWGQNLTKLAEIKLQLRTIAQKIQGLKTVQIKTLPELTAAVATVTDLQKSINDAQAEIITTRGGFQTELAGLSGEIAKLTDTANHDYQALLKLAKIPDFSQINLTQILLGKSLLNQSAIFIDVVDKLQAFIPPPSKIPPKQKPQRRGQDIIFPGRRTYPGFLIKYISISGREAAPPAGDGYYAKGTVTGITSEPSIYGHPIQIDLGGETPNHSYLKLAGNLNHISPDFDDRFSLKLGNLTLPDLNFSNQPDLPQKITIGNAEILTGVTVQPHRFNLNILIDSSNIGWNFPANQEQHGSDNVMSEIIKQTLARIDRLTIVYQLEGKDNRINMNISSNIDQLFNERLNEVIGEKVNQFKREIRAKVDQILRQKQPELESTKTKLQNEVSAEFQQLQTLLNKEKRAIEAKKKELEQKINQEAANNQNELTQKLKSENDKTRQELEKQLNILKNQLAQPTK
jgi:uncharacterized protein (TIGR03545 family)